MRFTYVEYCSECDAEVRLEIDIIREGSRFLWELADIEKDCDCDTKTDWEWARDAVESDDPCEYQPRD